MKARQYIIAAILATATLTFCACENDDTDFSSRINGSTNNDDSSDDEEPTIDIREIALDESDLDEGTETIPTAATSSLTYNDYWENSDWDYTVYIAYSGTTATVTGNTEKVSVETDGAYVTITSTSKHMHYIVSGTTGDGHLQIYSDNKYKLTLNGLTMKCLTRSAINNQCGKTMYVHLAEGTTNTLEDAASYTTATNGEDEKGAFFSEGQVIFSGKGSLRVTGNAKNGIASDDYIRFRPGCKVSITTTNGNGIKVNDGLYVSGGVINISVNDAAGYKGINSEAFVNIDGGRTTIINSSATRVESTNLTKSAAIKCDSTYTQTAGTVNLKATGEGGKGLNADKGITISGGQLNVVTLGDKTNASPKGISSDIDIAISAAKVYSYSANASPIDATGTLSIAEGYSLLEQSDRLFNVEY